MNQLIPNLYFAYFSLFHFPSVNYAKTSTHLLWMLFHHVVLFSSIILYIPHEFTKCLHFVPQDPWIKKQTLVPDDTVGTSSSCFPLTLLFIWPPFSSFIGGAVSTLFFLLSSNISLSIVINSFANFSFTNRYKS